jgi:hypothetical protein
LSTASPVTAAPAPKPRTSVYIDGFNLYFGALKGTSSRWLDLDAFCRLLLPRNNVRKIKYFTAHVHARPTKPTAAAHQDVYLRALRTLPSVEIYFGHYLSHSRWMPLAAPGGGVMTNAAGKVQFVEVLREEEKGSDVNLASHLIHDAHRGEFEVAVVITNDSDLATPVELVTRDLQLPVGVVNPHAENPRSRQSAQLRQVASFLKPVRAGALRKCQFPNHLQDRDGIIIKPQGW